MKITGKHALEMPVSVEFEIASAPQPERIEELEQIEPTRLLLQMRANTRKIKKLARTIKKDTKRLLRTLEKMKRHGWLVVDKTDEPPLCWCCGSPVLNRDDGFMHKTGGEGGGKEALVHNWCHNKIHKKNREEERKQ